MCEDDRPSIRTNFLADWIHFRYGAAGTQPLSEYKASAVGAAPDDSNHALLAKINRRINRHFAVRCAGKSTKFADDYLYGK